MCAGDRGNRKQTADEELTEIFEFDAGVAKHKETGEWRGYIEKGNRQAWGPVRATREEAQADLDAMLDSVKRKAAESGVDVVYETVQEVQR